MRWNRLAFAASLMAAFTGSALASSATGTWRTAPDQKGQTALVVAKTCGAALCGQISSVHDARGQRIDHPNVGVRLFWDAQPVGSDAYEGRAFVPAFNMTYRATMHVKGNELRVRGCKAGICRGQTWTRVD